MRYILSLLLTLSLTPLFAQYSITGTVSDAESKQPLEGASVFAQNTSLGTVTKDGGRFSLSLNKGGFEIVISFTGYASQRFSVTAASADLPFSILLKKEDQSLSEVVVQSTNEVADGWAKHGKFFLDHFLGTTPNADSTVLQNPEALKFFYYRRSDKLKVLATEPLRIRNGALGYGIQYALDSFVFYNKSGLSSYRGNALYAPLEGDSAQMLDWAAARKAAYAGSRLHFLRSYYDTALADAGFTIDLPHPTRKGMFNRVWKPYDTAYYYFDDSTATAEIWFPAKASITYAGAKPHARYLKEKGLPKDVPVQISYVDLKDAILIETNGYFTDSRSWINAGYWSWKNVADALPWDYEE